MLFAEHNLEVKPAPLKLPKGQTKTQESVKVAAFSVFREAFKFCSFQQIAVVNLNGLDEKLTLCLGIC